VFWLRQLGLVDEVPEYTPTYFRAILDDDIERAVAFWRSRGVPYEEGLALAFGDVPSQLQSIEIFESLGATAAANRVRERLRQAGAQVPRGRSRTTRAHAVGLTARQAEVLGLLAAGMSNAGIADELFISHRTVENHVAAVLMKLDVPDRQAAAHRAVELGLLDGS
jgi:DNA-binding CsgD family transcriptional regulator